MIRDGAPPPSERNPTGACEKAPIGFPKLSKDRAYHGIALSEKVMPDDGLPRHAVMLALALQRLISSLLSESKFGRRPLTLAFS